MVKTTHNQVQRRLQHWHWRPLSSPGAIPALRGADQLAATLQDKNVLMLGLGAIGARTFQGLARIGVGHLVGIDLDVYGQQSWCTQPCFPEDAGSLKAQVQGELAHRINPGIQVTTFAGQAQDIPWKYLQLADLILVAGDNYELGVWAGERAVAFRKRVLHAAVDGDSWLPVVRRFDLRDPTQACPGCTLSDAQWLDLQSRHGCDPELSRVQGRTPTRTLPHVCATAAQMLVNETLKSLGDRRHLGAGQQPAESQEIALSLLPVRVLRSQLPRARSCRCPHQPYQVITLEQTPAKLTLADVLTELEIAPTQARVAGERDWVSHTVCASCYARSSIQRLGAVGEPVGACLCGEQLLAIPQGTYSVVPLEQLRANLQRPLQQLGLSEGEALTIRVTDDAHDCAQHFCVFLGQLDLDPAPVSSRDEYVPKSRVATRTTPGGEI